MRNMELLMFLNILFPGVDPEGVCVCVCVCGGGGVGGGVS